MVDDDGFGPVLRGGPDTAARAARGARPAETAPDDGFSGPPARGGRRSRTGSVLRLLLTGALVLGVVAAAGGTALAFYTSAQMRREDVTGLAGGVAPLNVLVVGSDSREGFTPEELQAIGTEAVEGRRTDTMFLLSISGGRAAMLSFPRDLFVTRCDGTQGRINGAYASGGPSCLVQTVSTLSGIEIDHYVEVNLLGFTRIVDAVGGVPIFLDEPLVDRFAGVDLAAGCQVLDGRTALGFVRARHVDNDLGRIARQQRFLKELAGEVISAHTLVNVPRLFRVAGAAGASVTADRTLGIVDLLRLARAARGLAGAGLATYTVPANGASIGGAAVLVPDLAQAETIFGQFRDGSILRVPTAEEVAALQPGDVPVAVRNGAGVEGLAAEAQAFLSARGFRVTDIGDAEGVERTVVRHAPGQEAAARLLVDALPGAAAEAVDGLDGVVLVLGPDARLAGPPPAPPTPQPEPGAEAPVGSAPVPAEC